MTVCALNGEAVEDERQEVVHAVEFADALGADEDDLEGPIVFLLVFGHDLAAGAAGGGGAFAEDAVVGAGDSQRVKGDVRIIGPGPEHGGALGAEAGRVGDVFLVGTLDDDSVREPEGCSYLKIGIR